MRGEFQRDVVRLKPDIATSQQQARVALLNGCVSRPAIVWCFGVKQPPLVVFGREGKRLDLLA